MPITGDSRTKRYGPHTSSGPLPAEVETGTETGEHIPDSTGRIMLRILLVVFAIALLCIAVGVLWYAYLQGLPK